MKGILFTPAMALAACDGRKTVTRRVVAPPKWMGGAQPPTGQTRPYLSEDGWWFSGVWRGVRCDYVAGERRCLLTTWATRKQWDHVKPKQLSHDAEIWHAGDGDKSAWSIDRAGKSRPGRFLPNSLRHLMPVFEIVSVRAERVQDITEEDAKAEGADIQKQNTDGGWIICGPRIGSHREGFRWLWDSINAKRGFGWASNPWVWRVEFRKVTEGAQ